MEQVEWNRAAVTAGQGKVASVGATRVWGGGEMKQAARWVQGSALGRNGTSGSCAGGGEVVQRGQGAQGGGTKQQAGTKQTGSGSEQIRVGQGLPGQWVGVCQGEVALVGAAREWGGREAKQAAGRHQWRLARSGAGGLRIYK